MKSDSLARTAFAALLLLFVGGSLLACDDQVQLDNGLLATLRVVNGQYFDEPFPVDTSPDASAPAPQLLADGGVAPGLPRIQEIDTASGTVKRGASGKSVHLVVEQNATMVAVSLEGDRGYWLTPVTVRSIEFAPGRELTASIELDRKIPLGAARLWFSASDAAGNFGPARSLDLTVLDDLPSAPLVVSLTWTANMDLDLSVVRPDGSELTNKVARVSATSAADAEIDLDSNGSCVIDGHREENAAFTVAEAGTYSVFVHLASACGVPESAWTVRLFRDRQEVTRAQGASYASELALPNGGPAGPGRLALRFNIGG